MTSQTSRIDLQDLSARDVYFLLTSVVVPRPIAWVSTVDGDGRSNLAPFSYFNGVCSDPPLISISIGDHKGQPILFVRFKKQACFASIGGTSTSGPCTRAMTLTPKFQNST